MGKSKKSRKSLSNQKKLKTASSNRRLLINRRRIIEEPFAKICCRCELRITDNKHALGGGYDGIICMRHRSCSSCWFDSSARGARKLEAAKTKRVGLVNKPFKGSTPLCPGCKKGLPPFEIKLANYIEKDNVIHILDSDSD